MERWIKGGMERILQLARMKGQAILFPKENSTCISCWGCICSEKLKKTSGSHSLFFFSRLFFQVSSSKAATWRPVISLMSLCKQNLALCGKKLRGPGAGRQGKCHLESLGHISWWPCCQLILILNLEMVFFQHSKHRLIRNTYWNKRLMMRVPQLPAWARGKPKHLIVLLLLDETAWNSFCYFM